MAKKIHLNTKQLRRAFITAFSLVLILLGVGEWITYSIVLHQKADNQIVESAARQEILAVQLLEVSMHIEHRRLAAQQVVYKQKLANLLKSFEQNHQVFESEAFKDKVHALVDKEKDLTLDSIFPAYQSVLVSLHEILQRDFVDTLAFSASNNIFEENLTNLEDYLGVLNSFSSYFKVESEQYFERLKLVHFIVLGAVIFTIVLLGFFLVGPAIAQIRKQSEQLNQFNQTLSQQVEERTQEIAHKAEALERSNEELNALNEQISESFEEVRRTNELLVQTDLELQLVNNRLNAQMRALNSATIVAIADLKGIILFANETFVAVSGYSLDELKGQNHRIINSGHHSKSFWQGMWQTIAKGKIWRAEVCNRKKDGKLYWVDTTIAPIFDEKGKINSFISIRFEITKRKEAEDLLLKSYAETIEQQRFIQTILDASPDWIVVKDAASRVFKMTNKSFKNDLLTNGIIDVIGKTAADLGFASVIAGEDAYESMHSLEDWVIAQGKMAKLTDVKITMPWGETLWMDIVAVPMKDNSVHVHSLLIFATDVSEKKFYTDNIKAKQEALEASINYAERIQKAILPTKEEIDAIFSSYFVFYQPRDIVSGDFYWFAKKGDCAIVVAIDCTGHGVPGAFMTLIANELLQEIVHMNGITAPSEILTELHHALRRSLRYHDSKINDGMEVGIVTVCEKEQTLFFAGARSRPLLIIDQSGQVTSIKGDLLPIGGHELGIERVFTQHVMSYDQPINCYLASDGFQDQFGGPDDRKFMAKRLRETLVDLQKYPIEQQLGHLKEIFSQWKGTNKQTDDVLMIGFSLAPSPNHLINLSNDLIAKG